jgi:hypothetical protein
LALGEGEDRIAHRLVRQDVGLAGLVDGMRRFASEVRTSDRAVPEVARHEVHDRPAQVRGEGIGVAEVVQAPDPMRAFRA